MYKGRSDPGLWVGGKKMRVSSVGRHGYFFMIVGFHDFGWGYKKRWMYKTVETRLLKSQSLMKQFNRCEKGREIFKSGGNDSEAMFRSNDSKIVIFES